VANIYVGMNVKVMKSLKKNGQIVFQGAIMTSVLKMARRTEKYSSI
jgi:hypothetical protein